METSIMTTISNIIIILIWLFPVAIALLILFYLRLIHKDVCALIEHVMQRKDTDTKRE